MYQEVISDNKNLKVGRQRYRGAEFLHTNEAKWLLFQSRLLQNVNCNPRVTIRKYLKYTEKEMRRESKWYTTKNQLRKKKAIMEENEAQKKV